MILPSCSAGAAESANVSCLGPEGTCTKDTSLLFLDLRKTVSDAVRMIDSEMAFAVIPQENLLGSPVCCGAFPVK